MNVIDWLMDSDPAIRWQVMRDLTDAPADEVAAERARVVREGWGAQILAAQDPDGRWSGGTFWKSNHRLPAERVGTRAERGVAGPLRRGRGCR